MQVLFTGASSRIGRAVLTRLLEITSWQFHCVRHRNEIGVSDPRVSLIDLDLAAEFGQESLPEQIELVIHFAAVTHSREPEAYRRINRDATAHLADAARARGCKQFVYISTRCATRGSGAYGESKLAAEVLLKERSFDRLLIIRPSEVFGGAGSEGLDKFISLAKGRHVVPMLFGHANIRFSPLFIDDFVTWTSSLVTETTSGVSVAELCGPEELSGVELASRLAKAYAAIPLPLWWPATQLMLTAALSLGSDLVSKDQISRLVCQKTCDRSDRPGLRRFFPTGE